MVNRKTSYNRGNTSMQKIVMLLFLSLISVTLFRCANMQRPTGGPKDSIAPQLLSEVPANLTRNFTDKEIVLTFDEYIKKNNEFKEFSISPDTEKQPIYKVKKKKLHIVLPDSLEQNTTYTINLGNGLVDYNEGNILKNYTYVFATGPELDSLTISGKVKNAYTKVFDEKEDKEVKVLLIPTSQDTIFGKKKANIFTTVDTSGNFQFRNLREDTYRIYALKEQNNDRVYNNPDELLGFLKDSIVLNKNITGIALEYSKGKPEKIRTIEKKIEKNAAILLTFNQPLDKPSVNIIDPINLNDTKIVKFQPNNDSAYVYLKQIEFDSIKIQLSDNQNIIDTILLRRGKNEKYDRTIIPSLNISNKVDKTRHIRLTAKTPIASVDKNKIQLLEDSVSRRNFQLQQDTVDKNLYHIRYNWRPNKNYELVLEEKAIIGPFEEFNKEQKTPFTLDEADNYGDIIFDLKNLEPDVNYIVQLIDEQKKIIYDSRSIKNKNNISYIKFPGGKYSIRIIKDLNNNNRWDGANVYTKIQAEPIWYLDKTFTIRANWEQNETLDIKFD